MKNTRTSDIQIFESLRNALGFFGDETNVIYKSKFVDKNTGFVFNSSDDLLNSLHEFGFQGKTLKEAGFELEEWYEILKQNQETITEVPRPTGPEATTLTSDQLKNLGEFAEKRDAALKQSREKAVSDVASTQARIKEIYDQQRIIQDQIKKAEELQPKFVGKKVYATVEQQELVTNLEAQKSFETLTQAAIYNEYDLTDQLTAVIQEKAGLEETEILIAKTLAVQLVADIAHAEEVKEESRKSEIEKEISLNKDKVLDQVLQQENTLIDVAKKGAIVEAEKLKESVYLTREIAENLFGEDVANEIYGPKQIKVILSSEKNESTTHEVDLGNSNKASVQTYKERYDFFEKVRKGGIDETKNIFRSQLGSNVNTYLSKKAISNPNSLLGKMGSSDAVKAILTQGSPNALELKYFGKNPLLQTYFKYSPESMPYFKLFAEVTGVSAGIGVASKIIPLTYGSGAVPYAKIAYIQQVKSLGVPYTLGIKTGEKIAIGKAAGQAATQTGVKAGLGTLIAKGAAAIGVSSGVFTFGVSTAITAAIIGVGKMFNWPKVKQWFRDNKEIFVFGGAGLGLFLGGPIAGLVAGGLLMAATGSLAAFATGAFGVLGLIGRSVGIAIATPVIVTLLVLPPLVAFIMLVINNSAYVLPPKPVVDGPFDGSIGNFYCTEEKESTGITYSVNSPIAMRAFGIVEDLYQGFWCSWNRSPGDLPTDTVEYPHSYPLLFDMDEFRKNPNPIRGEVSGCGNCMFWCTWLVQKAYSENDVEISNTLWSPDMYRDFESRKKIILKDKVTPTNVELGAVVFFDVFNSENRIDHVAIVYSVNSDGITFVQSNAGTKKDFIPFNESGVGITDLPYATVIGIGNP